MQPHRFSVLGFLQQRITANSCRTKNCFILTSQLNATHIRCSYHRIWLMYHSSLIYAKSATMCCTFHQMFTSTYFHGVLGDKAREGLTGLTQTCLILRNRNSYCICQMMQDSNIDSSEHQPKGWESHLEQKVNEDKPAMFSSSMALKPLIFTRV